ncbi:PREDICTED: uncharacterized protein LOC109158023 [Ipomoea nil]|uniref:uncharacterized protein LOC109158023 n=1 Tax=Ipomoea nil TaxID=35883 RepID=UPI0009012468|nr:PREDICTED: uncharacterized protein LOC109158023 [Ipomoea nil]
MEKSTRVHKATGRCSISSAYNIAIKDTDHVTTDNWKEIWRIKVPNKICRFIWMAKHKWLMTNIERKRRGFTIDARCPNCDALEEDVQHCIRDCTKAMEIWEENWKDITEIIGESSSRLRPGGFGSGDTPTYLGRNTETYKEMVNAFARKESPGTVPKDKTNRWRLAEGWMSLHTDASFHAPHLPTSYGAQWRVDGRL